MQPNERKQMIQQGFDTVAPGYDHPALFFFPETATRLVEVLKLQPQQHLLDVCTGTGAVALTAAAQLPQGRVTGIDLSSGMLQQARNMAAQKNLANTEFHQLDVEDLSLAALKRDHAFDIATSSFGLFFIEDLAQALGNIAATVKPGGKIAISSFAGDAFAPMADIFLQRFEATGRTVPPLSWKRLATAALITEVFNAAGITSIDFYHEPLGRHLTDAQAWWDVVWNAGWRGLLNQLTADEQAQFKDEHMQDIAEVIGRDGVWFST